MGFCFEELESVGISGEIYTLDQALYYKFFFFCVSEWGPCWLLSKLKGTSTRCSLSPYLFVLCMNVLSMNIDRAVVEKKFKFHPGCKSLSPTHLCFTDDLMVFVEGLKKSIEGASLFLKCLRVGQVYGLVWRNLRSLWLVWQRLRRVVS